MDRPLEFCVMQCSYALHLLPHQLALLVVCLSKEAQQIESTHTMHIGEKQGHVHLANNYAEGFLKARLKVLHFASAHIPLAQSQMVLLCNGG